MIFREIPFGTDEYALERALREEVLRAPLGLSLQDEDLLQEKKQLHFGVFAPDGKLVACVIAVPLSSVAAKIRQMAVSPSRQGKGLGQRIMHELEKNLQGRGFRHFVLHARVSAVEFYKKLGYAVVSDEFVEVTIPHVKMAKTIQQNPAADR
jgi:predicted GNAT family N-acyltransferase